MERRRKRKGQRCRSRKKDEWEQQEESPVLEMYPRSRLDEGLSCRKFTSTPDSKPEGFCLGRKSFHQ